MKALQGSFFAASRTLHGEHVTPKRIGFLSIWVFPKIMVPPPPKSSILIGFSIINHPFWGILNFWKHSYLPMRNSNLNLLWKNWSLPSFPAVLLLRQGDFYYFFSRCTLKVTLEHCFGLLKCQQIPEKTDMAPVSNVLLYDPPVTKLSNLTSGPTSFSALTSTKHWSLQLW